MSSIVNIKGILSVLLVLAVTVGCQTLQDSPKQTVGTLIGAGLGALTGSQIGGGKGQLAAVAIGALGGAYLGSELGASLDRADKLYAQRNAQDSLEYSKTGNALAWKNPDSGHSGTFTPTRTFQTAAGISCRDFETMIYVDGKEEAGTGRACRQPDGTWKIVQ